SAFSFSSPAQRDNRRAGVRESGEGGLKARGASATAKSSANDSAERALIEAAQRDRRRFADLYEANFERVYAYVARRVRDRDEAQDLTADVFHLALRSLPRFEWRGVPFAAWLFRIASNEIADRSKTVARSAAHRRVFQESDYQPEIASTIDEAERRARLFKL